MERPTATQVRRRRRPALSCAGVARSNATATTLAHVFVRQISQCIDGIELEPLGRDRQGPGPAPGPERGSAQESTASPAAPAGPQIQGEIQVASGSVPRTTAAAVITPGSLGRSETRPQAAEDGGQAPDMREMMQRIQRLEEASAPHFRPNDDDDDDDGVAARGRSEAGGGRRQSLTRPPPDGPHGSSNWQAVLNKSRDLARCQAVGSAPVATPIISCYRAMTGGGDVDSITNQPQTTETVLMLAQARELLRKCKERAQRLKVGRPSRSLPAPQIGLVPPARDVADAMIQYDKFWSQTDSTAMDLRLQVLLVIGIGSSLHDHVDTDAALCNMEMVHQWIFAAQTWLSGPLEKDRLNIAGLQIYCLTILIRQIFSVRWDLAWLSMRLLVNEAMQMGLHRDPKYLPAMPVLRAELRRRLWASIVDRTGPGKSTNRIAQTVTAPAQLYPLSD
ncbi:hypothetical protein DL771_005630 [Monosporascus sp. 5C6A]|nr:hypothetical protein DL771_005630 [Monosporascus sp. 5C6A]